MCSEKTSTITINQTECIATHSVVYICFDSTEDRCVWILRRWQTVSVEYNGVKSPVSLLHRFFFCLTCFIADLMFYEQ